MVVETGGGGGGGGGELVHLLVKRSACGMCDKLTR